VNEKQVVRSPEAPVWDVPISPANAWKGLVFASGELGADPATLAAVPGGIAEQARQALRNLSATLAAAGSSLDHVLKVNAYMRRAEDFDAWNTVFAEAFPQNPPARTTVGVELFDEFDIEIELIAYTPES
jgi:2-iminobutanoate/2-iminopropanoate deaminase